MIKKINLDLLKKIESFLPQTQCRKCGFKDCGTYAKSVLEGDKTDKCVPGGSEVSINIEMLLQHHHEEKIYKTSNYWEPYKYGIAAIDEDHCIGCTICINICPADAILGAKQRNHTVLSDFCSGCGLCVERCPVDCINMELSSKFWSKNDAEYAKIRYEDKKKRIEFNKKKKQSTIDQVFIKKQILANALEKARKLRKAHNEKHQCGKDVIQNRKDEKNF